jgi:hypothetical protein
MLFLTLIRDGLNSDSRCLFLAPRFSFFSLTSVIGVTVVFAGPIIFLFATTTGTHQRLQQLPSSHPSSHDAVNASRDAYFACGGRMPA